MSSGPRGKAVLALVVWLWRGVGVGLGWGGGGKAGQVCGTLTEGGLSMAASAGCTFLVFER